MQPIICLIGTTASGKTNIAQTLATQIPTQLISVDSGAIYKEIHIGTTKPSPLGQQQFSYQLINKCSVLERYSVAQFLNDATDAIRQSWKACQYPVLVGGTMMYFYTLFKGLSTLPATDPKILKQLQFQLEKNGNQNLHKKLSSVDPNSALKIHQNDTQRLLRALCIYQQTGIPISTLQNSRQPTFSPKQFIIISTDQAKNTLNHAIEKRFNTMLKNGLIEEIQHLQAQLPLHPQLPAMRLIGYQQGWRYLAGEIDHPTFFEQAINATKQLAKHQRTWIKTLSKHLKIDTEHTDQNKSTEQIMHLIQTHHKSIGLNITPNAKTISGY